MASSEESLDFANQIHAPLNAYSVFNHHPTIMGDMRNGRFKYLFEFAITPTHLSRSQAKIFGANSASSLQLAPRPQRPIRIAVIGNHLPRQCGIATFTTDLCNAIAAEYGAAQLSVVAINDGQSSYHTLSGYIRNQRRRSRVLQSGSRVFECGRCRSGVLTA